MKLTIFLTAVFIYAVYAAIAYSPIKESKWYIPLGLVLALSCNFLWLVLSRLAGPNTHVMFWALLLDIGIILTQLAVPIVFFGVRMTPSGYLGIAMAVAGVLILKMSMD